MPLTAAQLLADQSFLFGDFPTETVSIAGVNYACLVPRADNRNDWEFGGLKEGQRLTILINRNLLTVAPQQGGLATIRGAIWRIGMVRHDHPNSPIMLELESDQAETAPLMAGSGASLLAGSGLRIVKGEGIQ